MGKGSDKRYTYTGSHRRAGRGGREVRRTGDRVHCAAASATYGRVALTRQRGQGIRENPPPVPGRAAPHALAAAVRRRPAAAKGLGAEAAGIVCQAGRSQLIRDCTSEFGTIPVINQ